MHCGDGQLNSQVNRQKADPITGIGITKHIKPVRLRTLNSLFSALIFVFAVCLLITAANVHTNSVRMEEANKRHFEAEIAAGDLTEASAYLTECARSFAATGDLKYLRDYFEEANVTKRRETAVAKLDALLDEEKGAQKMLARAFELSNELMQIEFKSMKLMQIAGGIPDSEVPEEIAALKPDPEYESMTPHQLKDAAVALLFDDAYSSYQAQIQESVDKCTENLIETSRRTEIRTLEILHRLLVTQTILVILLIAAVAAEAINLTQRVRIPLRNLLGRIERQEFAVPDGVTELRDVSKIYNELLEENLKARRQLTYEASHDTLTGLYNRSAYKVFMENHKLENIALLLLDLDEFKIINDTYGHETGDRILKKTAEILKHNFRTDDFICRLGGDEFCIIMIRVTSELGQLVRDKTEAINDQLMHPDDGLPAVSLSVGAAFSDCEELQGDIFSAADSALYKVKNRGRCGCAIYGEDAD